MGNLVKFTLEGGRIVRRRHLKNRKVLEGRWKMMKILTIPMKMSSSSRLRWAYFLVMYPRHSFWILTAAVTRLTVLSSASAAAVSLVHG